MNKKQLIIAAMATVLSVSAANATTITGIQGNNGIYNIDPAMVAGDVGYRKYTDFSLDNGHTANLIFQGIKNGKIRDINSFINLVQNEINVQGIVNTMRGNDFFNGHAIFISPNGLTVGASGVLNVGQLSVITPTQGKFNDLTSAYAAKDFETLNKVSKLRSTEAVNYGGNAPVNIAGTVLARNGVDIRGSQVDIAGNIVNGFNLDNEIIRSADRAKELFNSLVNTDGIATANSLNNSSLVIVKSGKGANAGINITGKVANINNAETAITNHGDQGLTIAGTVAGNGKLNVYNNNTASALTVSGNLANKNKPLSVSNKGTDLDITSTAKLNTEDALEIVNNGSGQLKIAGTAISKGKTDIVNRSNGGTNITGTVGNASTSKVRIVNRGGKLELAGTTSANSVLVTNEGNGTGMTLAGTINAGEGILVQNKVGNADLNGTLNVTKGDIMIANEGAGKLTTSASSQINGNGKLAIKNTAANGMELNGTIVNTGETAINNYAGDMTVAGTITNTGNMGINNRDTAQAMTVNAAITNTGKLKVVNAGSGKQTINGTIANKNGNMYVYTDGGSMEVNGELTNDNGYLYVASRKNSEGIYTAENSKIENKSGSLAIRHEGTAAKGMDLNGTVKNTDGEIAINNYAGNMHVGGTVTANRNMGIINRAGGNSMNVDATINHTGTTANIKNFGSGDMTVNGEITHNGRLNVLANENKLNLGGKIHNEGTDMTYAAARLHGTGIDVKETFNADSTQGGMIFIKNITGNEGLRYDGTITNINGQAEIYNKAGDMVVNGAINGKPAVVLNTGDNLTVNDAADLQGEVKIVNKGKNPATIADKYKLNFREQLAE